MSELVDALERLMAEHRRVGSPFADYLRPGLDPDAIRAQTATIGLEAPDEAVELFAWHNGIDHDRYIAEGAGIGYGRLFDDVFFGKLDEAIAYYRQCLEIDRGNAMFYEEAEPTWRLSWFPPFSAGLPTYGIECDAASPVRGMVFEPWWHPPIEEPTRPRFRSLTHLVQSVVRRFEADGYWWDSKPGFLMSEDEVLEPLFELERREARGAA